MNDKIKSQATPLVQSIQRRKVITSVLGGAVASALPGTLWAQSSSFPNKPIRVLLGFPAGGSIDGVFRVMARAAGNYLGQPVVVENRPGAGGTISIVQMKNSAPDGYTLGLITMGVFRAPVIDKVAYDPLKDITYIISLTHVPFGIVVLNDAPWKTWEELLAFGKANADKINYGVAAGLGNSAHLLMEEVTGQEKTRWTPIPYKGSADTAQALLGGHVHFVVDGSGGFGPLVDSGRARLLAVASEQRSPRWPDVRTTKELGYQMTIDSPWGLGGPKDMDPQAVKAIHDAFKKSLDDEDVKATMLRNGQGIRYRSSEDFQQFAVRAAVDERALLTKYGFDKKD